MTQRLSTFDIRRKFRIAYRGAPNFMTPDVIRFGQKRDKLYELSTGKGIGGTPIWGVTVISVYGHKLHDLSECFSTRLDAERYIQGLSKATSNEPAHD